MGQVYQATDTQLGRDVALKILPDAFAADPDRLARFQREAQVLASLNHAGIAAIYGIEKSDDTQAFVLELVEGPTLAERIAKGPIPLDEALPIAKQIAEALEAAHEAGVIHRDLKPANIKVRADRTVKLLDFGLAKAMLGDSASSDLSQSPTMTAAATASGVILGTAVYMSPEQARGQPLDKRTDIWSFGCVLYEMLTGHRAFPGETFSDTIANILDREPDWQALPANVPHLITRLLRRCLRKRSAERQRDVGDARLDLEDPTPAVVSAGSETGRYRPVPSRGVLVALLVLALAALTVLGFLAGTRQVPAGSSTGVTRLQRLTDRVGLEEFPAMSPDGRSVAFTASVAGARQIFVAWWQVARRYRSRTPWATMSILAGRPTPAPSCTSRRPPRSRRRDLSGSCPLLGAHLVGSPTVSGVPTSTRAAVWRSSDWLASGSSSSRRRPKGATSRSSAGSLLEATASIPAGPRTGRTSRSSRATV